MARTILALQTAPGGVGMINLTSTEVAGDATDDVGFPNGDNVLLYVRNAGAGAHVLTFDTPGSVDGNAIANPATASIAAGGARIIGPFRRDVYDQGGANAGQVFVSCDGTKTEMKYVAFQR